MTSQFTDVLDEDENTQNGSKGNFWLYILLGTIIAVGAVFVLLWALGLPPFRKKIDQHKPANDNKSLRGQLQQKVVMVDWGTEGALDTVHSGTGLIAQFKGKVGLLTNYHVIPSENDADSFGHIHVNFTAKNPNDPRYADPATRSEMGISEMLETGIALRPHPSNGGFFYTGGQKCSGYDWSFVGFDWETFQKTYPDITPYDLTQTTVANSGDEVTVWHHGGMKPRRMVTMTVADDAGQQGTLTPKPEDPNAVVAGASGSPIFKSSDLKIIGLFWGMMELGQIETADRFVTIDAVLSQLSHQMQK